MSKILKNFSNVNYIYRGKKLGRGSAVLVGMKVVKIKVAKFS